MNKKKFNGYIDNNNNLWWIEDARFKIAKSKLSHLYLLITYLSDKEKYFWFLINEQYKRKKKCFFGC